MNSALISGSGTYDVNATTTMYGAISGAINVITTESLTASLVSTNGVIKDLRVKFETAPGAGTHYDITLMLNGAPTALTCEVADAAVANSDLVNQIDVTGGDAISVEFDPTNTPATGQVWWSAVFTGDNANEMCIFGTSGVETLYDSITQHCYLMGQIGQFIGSTSAVASILPVDGTFKNLYVRLSEDPGSAPDAYAFTLVKWTSDTALTCTIVANDTTGNDTVNTASFSAGERTQLRIEPVSTPSASPSINWGLTFVPDTGESIVLGGEEDPGHDNVTEYMKLVGDYFQSTTESYMNELTQAGYIGKLFIILEDDPGDGASYTFYVRKNGGNTNVVVTISDGDRVGDSGSLTDTVSAGDVLTLSSIPSGTPHPYLRPWIGMVLSENPIVFPWTGKISGVTDPAEVMGVAVADIAEVKGVA